MPNLVDKTLVHTPIWDAAERSTTFTRFFPTRLPTTNPFARTLGLHLPPSSCNGHSEPFGGEHMFDKLLPLSSCDGSWKAVVREHATATPDRRSNRLRR